MAKPAERKETMRRKMEEKAAAGDIPPEDVDAIVGLCRAYDENDVRVPKPEAEGYRTDRTIGGWYIRLSSMSESLDNGLTGATAAEINTLMQEFRDERGLAKNTVRNYQNAARRFYRYHDDLGVDPGEIARYGREGKKWDPEDVLTPEEIDACRDAIDSPRDNLIFHLLLYTGQRNTALRTLRVKDVRVDAGETGRYRLNPEDGGLKRANKNGKWRPLLAAEGAVREWLRYHPDPEPENYLITQKPSYSRCDPTVPVSRELPRRTMQRIVSEVGIDKPAHPHMMRHNFVTICKRDYDMDNDTIKWLIGHAPDSRVMETTYTHLSDEDWIERAEVAANYREPEEKPSSFTPPSCGNCGRSLGPNAKACDGCGMVITPDAANVQKQIQQDIGAARVLSDGEISDEELEAIAADDALLAKLIELRSGRSG